MQKLLNSKPTSCILLVDDDPNMIRTLAAYLKSLGRVHFTTRGNEAVELANSLQPDLILLDIEMPDLHGFEVCRQIQQTEGLENTPILFVTSHTDQSLEAQALESGGLDFIHKPPHPQVVKARVRNYLALKHQTDQLQQLSLLDGLTGVHNRRAFDKALEQEWSRSCRNDKPLSLIMIDIDRFKAFNDQYGHLVGDECLKAVAQTLAGFNRRPGDTVARYGGEEFVILLPNCELSHAQDIAQQACEAVAALTLAVAQTDAPVSITISLGVSEKSRLCQSQGPCRRNNPDPATMACELNQEDLLAAADQALYRAKNQGRNQVQT